MAKVTFKFNNGDTVKDTITGFVGVITGSHAYINGCIRYSVQPTKLKDGIPQDGQVFDEQQFVLVKAVKVEAVKPKGGPRATPRMGMNIK